MTIQDNIDPDRNGKLLDILKRNGHKIDLSIYREKEENINLWKCGLNNSFQIIAPSEIINEEFFTHELLHVFLISEGFLSSDIFFKLYYGGTFKFDYEFLQDLNNELAHYKMLPLFMKYGYAKENFLRESFEEGIIIGKEFVSIIPPQLNRTHIFNFVKAFSTLYFIRQYYDQDESHLEELKNKSITFYTDIKLVYDKWIESPHYINIDFYRELNDSIQRFLQTVIE